MFPEAPVNQPSPVEQLWQSLAHEPLTFDALNPLLPQMRQELLVAGLDLNPSSETINSLQQIQFRNWDEDRGPGVKKIIGQKSEKFFNICLQFGATCPKLKEEDENSKGRGLRQWVADTLLLLSNPNPNGKDIDAYVLKTNRRIKKYSEHKQKSNPVLYATYENIQPIEPIKKWKKFTSLPPEAVGQLWQFLISRI
jgi:hypothetical protein